MSESLHLWTGVSPQPESLPILSFEIVSHLTCRLYHPLPISLVLFVLAEERSLRLGWPVEVSFGHTEDQMSNSVKTRISNIFLFRLS
jgi:hypothetical protein